MTQSPGSTVRTLIIVARDQPDLWHYLMRNFAEFKRVHVLLDRRQRERRERVQAVGQERRQTDRRRPPSIEHDLRSRSFVIVREQQSVLEG